MIDTISTIEMIEAGGVVRSSSQTCQGCNIWCKILVILDMASRRCIRLEQFSSITAVIGHYPSGQSTDPSTLFECLYNIQT